MTNAEATRADAPDAVPRLPDADASGGGGDAASAGKAVGSRVARSGSSSFFSREELASLDAVREEAERRYTRALAPKLGEKTYGHSEREAEREAADAAQRAKATTGRSNDPNDPNDPSSVDGVQPSLAAPVLETAVSSDRPDSVQAASGGPTPVTATAKVGVAALMAEVKTRAREYVARREAEFDKAARAHAEAAERKAREQRARLAEEQKKQARGLGKVQFDKKHDLETDFAAEQKREAAARQAAERQRRNELLEARLRAWPMSRVSAAVEEAFRAALRERRRAAGLDQEDELFSGAEDVVADGRRESDDKSERSRGADAGRDGGGDGDA